MARNKSEKEIRAARHRPGGNVTIIGGSATSTMGKPFPWEGSIENVKILKKVATLAAIEKEFYKMWGSINELEEAGIVRTTKRGGVYLATQS